MTVRAQPLLFLAPGRRQSNRWHAEQPKECIQTLASTTGVHDMRPGVEALVDAPNRVHDHQRLRAWLHRTTKRHGPNNLIRTASMESKERLAKMAWSDERKHKKLRHSTKNNGLSQQSIYIGQPAYKVVHRHSGRATVAPMLGAHGDGGGPWRLDTVSSTRSYALVERAKMFADNTNGLNSVSARRRLTAPQRRENHLNWLSQLKRFQRWQPVGSRR